MTMSGRDQSDAIWIRQQEQKAGRNQSGDFGYPSGPRFGFTRSMSVNSEGASTTSSSPPYSPIDMSGRSGPTNTSPIGGGRFRTSSFSSGYGPSYGQDHDQYERDPYLMHSPLSTSAPGREGLFRRSNSISVGALEHSHNKNAKNAAYNLGPIEEYSKMTHFGDAFKRSMGQLFSAPKIVAPARNSLPNGIKEKKQGQMKDRVVSMLCESAIR